MAGERGGRTWVSGVGDALWVDDVGLVALLLIVV